MRGRKPVPTILKRLEGNPGKRRLNDNEPTPPVGTPQIPEHLDEEARSEWSRITKALQEMNLLATTDRTALACYCTLYSRWVQAERDVEKYGSVVKAPSSGYPQKSPYLSIADSAMKSMLTFLTEFGMTPAARSRIRVPEDSKAADEFDLFMEAG